jgi:hypothetical protein
VAHSVCVWVCANILKPTASDPDRRPIARLVVDATASPCVFDQRIADIDRAAHSRTDTAENQAFGLTAKDGEIANRDRDCVGAGIEPREGNREATAGVVAADAIDEGDILKILLRVIWLQILKQVDTVRLYYGSYSAIATERITVHVYMCTCGSSAYSIYVVATLTTPALGLVPLVPVKVVRSTSRSTAEMTDRALR